MHEQPYRFRRTFYAAALAFAGALATSLGAPQPAAAQRAPAGGDVTGVVLAIEQDELIVDIGSERGAALGDSVEIWRPLKLKHPVTGKVFTDRFLIGTLQLSQVRPALSLAKVVGTLTRDPEKGDVIIMASKSLGPTPADVRPAPSPPSPSGDPYEEASPPPGANQDPDVAAIAKMLDNLRGADPAQRIRVYEDYVRTQPKGRFARFLYEEAQALRKVYDLERKSQTGAVRATRTEEGPVLLAFDKPAQAVGGQPLRLAVELGDKATGAVLHVRSPGQPAYMSFPMAPSGAGYFSATIPGDKMVGAEVQFFIEAAAATGAVVPVVGQGGAPERIELQKSAAPPARAKTIQTAMILTDYADYNRFRGNDRVWQTEGFFQTRYGDTGVRALRTGFGVYRGVGGSVTELDLQNLAPRRVGLTYGYLELEMAPLKVFSIIGRTVVGLDEDGVTGGGQILFRIGNDLQTNLVLGGELLGGVGLRGFTQLELNTFPRFPILLRIEVTNQPAGARASDDQIGLDNIAQGSGEVGGRGIVQAGWRIVDPLVVSVRGSFQGRTINHAGPGFGAAVSYTW